jgi:alpha-beta hydrolase superfamily lysophospholipase
MQTFAGIDTCGKRLAEEIREVVARNPSLKYISFLGHSMGGLIVRHAAGNLYDPSSKLVAGLQPIHFIAMASPHLGCDASGESQVCYAYDYP